MSTMTGSLSVVTPAGIETYQWNGNPDDRAAARAAFEKAVMDGISLAVVLDAPGKAHTVQTFDEIEEVENERGTVVAQLSPPLCGG